MASSSGEIQLVITARTAIDAALASAQRQVAAMGPTTRRAAEEHRRGYEQMRRSTGALRGEMSGLSRQLETLSGGFAEGTAGLNMLRLGFAGAGLAAVGVGMAFNSTQSQMRNAFTKLLGGSAQAEDALNQLNNVADKIPFTLQTINEAGQRLAAAGFTNFTDIVKTIADAVAATGDLSADKFQSITSGFAALKGTGTFQYGIISDLMGAGVPIISALQKLPQYASMSTYAITQMLQRLSGRLPIDSILPQIMEALKTVTGGLAEAQLNTLSGAIVRLQDRFAIFMGKITGGATDVATTVVTKIGDIFDWMTTKMEGVSPKIRDMIGMAVLITSAVSGVSGLGGSVPGMGALGQLFGGKGGSTGGMIAIVLVIVALIALLTPWEAIFSAIQSLLEGFGSLLAAIKDAIDRLPHGGGGGALPPGVVPAVGGALILTPDMVDAQSKVDMWGALLGKIQLNPDRSGVQNEIDAWGLMGKLMLNPDRPTVQGEISQWANLTKDLQLYPPPRSVLQDEVDRWDPFFHPINVVLPGQEVPQGEIDMWTNLTKGLDLVLPGPEIPQGEIDNWPTMVKGMDLILPGPETPQGEIDNWPNLVKSLDLAVPGPEIPQTEITNWPSLVAGMNLSILPSPGDIQALLDSLFPNLKVDVNIDLKSPPDLGKLPGLAPDVPTLPGGISLIPFPGLGASGGQIGNIHYGPDGLPKFAGGGVVTSPTLAMVGEHGPEAIVPLGSMGGGGDTYNLHFNGPLMGHDIEDIVVRALDSARRGGRTT